MARYLRRDVGGKGHSRLGPPVVVNEAATEFVAFGPGVRLTNPLSRKEADQRRKLSSRLSPPTVVGSGVAAPAVTTIQTSLARITPPRYHSRLSPPPPVVGPGIYYDPIATTLARVPQAFRFTRYFLSPPTVVAIEPLAEPIRTTLAPQPKPETESRLQPPSVVGAGISFDGPRVKLAPPRDRVPPTQSRLQPPVLGEVAPAPVSHGPKTKLARVKPRRTATYRLAGPAIVFPPGMYLADVQPVATTLAPSRTPRGTFSRLHPVAIVGDAVAAVAFSGPRVRLADPHSRQHARRQTHSKLSPPRVVGDPVVGVVHAPVITQLAPSHRRSRAAHPNLPGPEVINAAEPVQYPIQVELTAVADRTARVRREPIAALRSPQVVGAPVPVETTITVTLASRFPNPRHRDITSRLRPPQVVGAGVSFDGPRVKLAPPLDRVPPTRSLLLPPQVVEVAYFAPPLAVSLAPSSRLARGTHPKLRRPAVVGAGVYFRGILVETVAVRAAVEARTRRKPKPKFTGPPKIVGAGRFFRGILSRLVAVRTPLDRIRRKPKPELRPPVSVGDFVPPLGEIDFPPVVCDDGTLTAAECDDGTLTGPACDAGTLTAASDDSGSFADAADDTGTFTEG